MLDSSRQLFLLSVLTLWLGLYGGVPSAYAQPSGDPQLQPEAPLAASETAGDSLFSIIVPPYEYDVTGRRDPFAQPLVERPLDALPSHGPFLPLELVDLSEIKVKAILWDVQNPRALIQGPDGRVHNIGLSDKVGKNNGYVAMIREGELVLVESFEEDGKVYSTTRILPISK